MKRNLILILIILLAGFLRFWHLNSGPIALFGDEIDVGYQAYSLLKTGKDYMGQPFPVYIHSLSEWRAPLFIYGTVPSIAIFGLNEWGVRGGSAFFGVLGIFLVYLLGKKLKDGRFGLIAAFVLSVLPWHIHYSRAAFEVTLLLDLLMIAVYFFLSKRYLISATLFALTPYTYSTAAVFTPLFVLPLLYFSRKDITSGKVTLFAMTGLLIALPFLYMTQIGPAKGRFELLSIFNNDRLIDQINIERSETNSQEERLFHNKFSVWSEVIGSNYVRSFSPDFLFVHGDPQPRHNIPGTGQLYWGFLPFLLYGLYKLTTTKGDLKVIVLTWLLIAPIPASLTNDGGNHATRLFLMVTPISFLIAYAIYNLWTRKLLINIMLLFVFCNAVFYFHRYYSHYSYQNWKYWNYGYKEAMQIVANNQEKYNMIFINNTYQPSLLEYLFWSKYDPEDFHKQFTGDVPQDDILPNFNGFKLGERLYFGETKEVGSFIQPGQLYLAAQQKEIPGDWDWSKTPPKEVRVIDVIHTPQGQPLFTVVTK